MWRERINEAKKELGVSTKTMSERTLHIPERTIIRMLNGETEFPRIDTVLEVGASVGLSPQEIFSETNLVLGNKDLASLQADLDKVNAEKDILVSENTILKAKVAALTAEIDILKRELEHKEEIINVHNFYNNALKIMSLNKGETDV